MNRNRKASVLNALRIAAGVAGAILLALLYTRIGGFSNVAIYLASWVTFLHVCIGEFVLVRYLHARSHLQNALDLLAGLLLAGGMLSFTSVPLWCAFFSGVFALAVVKYMLIARDTPDTGIRQYVREKLRWETPAVAGLAILAIVLDRLPPKSDASYMLQIVILLSTTAFAIWMIAFRHIYRRVRKSVRARERNTKGDRDDT